MGIMKEIRDMSDYMGITARKSHVKQKSKRSAELASSFMSKKQITATAAHKRAMNKAKGK